MSKKQKTKDEKEIERNWSHWKSWKAEGKPIQIKVK
jgi:hypothetical protein